MLEPVYEATSDWPKLISVHEVQVKHATDPFQKVELLHRIARLYEDALDDHARRVRHVRARARRSTTATRQTLAEPRAPRDGGQPLAASRRALRRRARQARATNPERFVELGLRTAQIFEVQLEDVDSAIARYRRVLDVDAREPDRRSARSIASSRRPSAGPSSPRSSRARPRSARSPDEILEFKYRLGQVQQTQPRQPRRGDRRVPRRPQRGARARGHARGPRGALRARR